MSTFHEIPFDKPIPGPEQQVDQQSFFLTQSQSRITQHGKFVGLNKIRITGKSIIEHNTTLRGDLAKIEIGYYVVIGEGTILKPSEKFGDSLQFIEMKIGDYTVVGRNCVIRAMKIGYCCFIGEGSVINNRCAIKDCAMILDDTVLAPGTVVPSYTVFAGNPGKCVGRLPPTFDMIMNEHTHAFYAKFNIVRQPGPPLTPRRSGRNVLNNTGGNAPPGNTGQFPLSRPQTGTSSQAKPNPLTSTTTTTTNTNNNATNNAQQPTNNKNPNDTTSTF